MNELAYVNGVFCPIAEATVSIEDRGFQFGDGVYEVIVAYDGRPFLPREHLARLKCSADAIGLDFDPDKRGLMSIIRDGLRRSGLGDALVYIQITRGTAPRAHEIPSALEPTTIVTFKPLPAVDSGLRRRGTRLMTIPDNRWSSCYVKAITLLPNVLAKNEAIKRGYDDALFVTDRGEVRECTSANIYVVHGRRVGTPRRNESILHGVTQGFIFKCAAGIGIDIEERTVRKEEFDDADEVFTSNTMFEILAVTSVDGKPVGDGCVGPVSRKLFEEFRSRCRDCDRTLVDKFDDRQFSASRGL